MKSFHNLAHFLFAGALASSLVAEDGGISQRLSLPISAESSAVQTLGPDAIVVNRGDLIHTGQFLGTGNEKDGFGLARLFSQLESFCRSRRLGLDHVAKLNLYVDTRRDGITSSIREALAVAWPPGTGPAVTFVHSRLPEGATFGMDAVLVGSGNEESVSIDRDSAVLPSDHDILYVSGRAARTGTLDEATRETMEQLFRVIAEVGSGPRNVVQVKSFLQPMDDWESAKKAIEAAFGEHPVPPIVIVEWTSSFPTEIEMIAAAPRQNNTAETVTYFTPNGDKASPIFSRIARVHSDQVIYFGGIAAASDETPLEETKRAFNRLQEVALAVGSDLRHLAKATYYVSDGDFSKQLNEVRRGLYDPARPPAASKVAVLSTGNGESGLLMDFIAVPVAH